MLMVKNITVHNPLPNVAHKEALQIIANAGRCIMDYDRYGRIRIYSAFLPDFETTSNGAEEYSDVKSIDNDTVKDHYASYSQDFWSADGAMLFLPEQIIETQNTGYVSEQISGNDGLFTENPVITRTLEAKYKCFGINIKFSGNLPKKFIIHTYADGSPVENVTVDSNISQNFELPYGFHEFDKIEIEFVETSVPNNRILIDYISFGAETDYTVKYDDLYSTPTGTQLEKVKNINVSREIYSPGAEDEELTSDTLTYDGVNHIYYFSDPCYGYSASITEGDGTVSILSSGAYFVELEFTGVNDGAEIKFAVTGRKYNVSESIYTVGINNRGNDTEWSNPLISDYEHCKDVAEWVADYLASGIEYELDFRGEPALDCGDTIFQENKYVDDLKVVIEEHQMTFNGTIDGALRTRRKERVARAKNGLDSRRLR